MNAQHFDVIVVGGGLVGAAIGYGLVREGLSVALCDADDHALRAARGNFGLVWVQGKGVRCISHAQWSLESSKRWHAFAAQLQRETGIDLCFERPGGFELCESREALEAGHARLAALHAREPELDYEVLDPRELRRRMPAASDQLAGALYSRHDGHASPLYTLRALYAAFRRRGGCYLPNRPVRAIERNAGRFNVSASAASHHTGGNRALVKLHAERVVLAAGLGNATLAPMVGLGAPVKPLREPIMVTERLPQFLKHPTRVVRQTREGSVMLGDSVERVGFDDGITGSVMAGIARRAQRAFPYLAHARIVRCWGALRIMTPDGLPVYEASVTHPGAFVAICHSGVTLAAAHADRLTKWIAHDDAPAGLNAFRTARLDRLAVRSK